MSRLYPLGLRGKIAPGTIASFRTPTLLGGMIDRLIIMQVEHDRLVWVLDVAWGAEAALEYRPGWQNDPSNPQRVYAVSSVPVLIYAPDSFDHDLNPFSPSSFRSLPPPARTIRANEQIRVTLKNDGLTDYDFFSTVLIEV